MNLLYKVKAIKPQLDKLIEICNNIDRTRKYDESYLSFDDIIEDIQNNNFMFLYNFLDSLDIDTLVYIKAIILFGEYCYNEGVQNAMDVYTLKNLTAVDFFTEIYNNSNRLTETHDQNCVEGFIVNKFYKLIDYISKAMYLLDI